MTRVAALGFTAACAAFLLLAVGGSAADSFTLTKVAETSSTITFTYPQQAGYGYLYSANGTVVSRTNDPTKTQIKFSKNTANSYEVASIVKGTTGSYNPAPPPPPPPPGDTTAPSAPANLRLSSATQTKIVVAWDASTDNVGVVDYRVYLDGAVRGTTDNTLDWADLNLTCGTSYQYAVEALDAAGNTSAKSIVTVATAACDTPPPPPPPPPTGFPDASNTGPSGTLTTYTGPSNITVAGTVIDSKNMGCIQVSAKNVTIKNSVIRCPGSDYYSVDVGSSGSVTVQDSIIDCQNHNSNGAGRMNITLLRVEIVNCENGLSVAHDVTVQDSYIHDLYSGGGAHDDGMQFEGGAYNVNIIHNTIYGVNAQGDQGTSSLIADLTGHHDWLIENNLFSGGAYTVYCVKGKGTNWVIRNNAFSTKYGKNGTSGLFGFSTECSDDTQSGNYVYETGKPITLG